MFNNNDYGKDKSIANQLLNTHIKNVGEKLITENQSPSCHLNSLDSNYNSEIFLICNEIEELISSLYNIPINVDYENYGRDLGNKRLVITSLQEINILKNVDTKMEVLDETLTNLLLNYDYIDDKQNLVEGKLDKHVQQVKQAYNALIEFFYTDFYSQPRVMRVIKLSNRITNDQELQNKYLDNIREVSNHLIMTLKHLFDNLQSFQSNLQK
jgi:hypothetical protein